MQVNFYGSKEDCLEKAKQLAKQGEIVGVQYNDFFGEWQIDIYKKNNDGILYVWGPEEVY